MPRAREPEAFWVLTEHSLVDSGCGEFLELSTSVPEFPADGGAIDLRESSDDGSQLDHLQPIEFLFLVHDVDAPTSILDDLQGGCDRREKLVRDSFLYRTSKDAGVGLLDPERFLFLAVLETPSATPESHVEGVENVNLDSKSHHVEGEFPHLVRELLEKLELAFDLAGPQFRVLA